MAYSAVSVSKANTGSRSVVNRRSSSQHHSLLANDIENSESSEPLLGEFASIHQSRPPSNKSDDDIESSLCTWEAFWYDLRTKRDFDICDWVFRITSRLNTANIKISGVFAWVAINIAIVIANYIFFYEVLPHYRRCGEMSDNICVIVYGVHFFIGWLLTIQVT